MFAGVIPVEDAGRVIEVVGMDVPALGTTVRREEHLFGLTVTATAWPIARLMPQPFGRLAVPDHSACASVRWRPASGVLSYGTTSEDRQFWREISNLAGYDRGPLRDHVRSCRHKFTEEKQR